jgi:hypothetical protein
MAKDPTSDEKAAPPRRARKTSARPATASPIQKRQGVAIDLVELSPGLFLNLDHVVSVRILREQDGDVYAIAQLSNGAKQNLTRAQFTMVSGEQPRPPARLSLKPPSK